MHDSNSSSPNVYDFHNRLFQNDVVNWNNNDHHPCIDSCNREAHGDENKVVDDCNECVHGDNGCQNIDC